VFRFQDFADFDPGLAGCHHFIISSNAQTGYRIQQFEMSSPLSFTEWLKWYHLRLLTWIPRILLKCLLVFLSSSRGTSDVIILTRGHLGRETGYPDNGVSWFFPVAPGKCWDSTLR
jgi:hypothetical protein